MRLWAILLLLPLIYAAAARELGGHRIHVCSSTKAHATGFIGFLLNEWRNCLKISIRQMRYIYGMMLEAPGQDGAVELKATG
jgi:hypothetical protein